MDSETLTSATAGDAVLELAGTGAPLGASGKGGRPPCGGGGGTPLDGVGFPVKFVDPGDRQTLRRELDLSKFAGGGV